jgi:hypothetical protein
MTGVVLSASSETVQSDGLSVRRHAQPFVKFDPEVTNVLFNSGHHQPCIPGNNRRSSWPGDLAGSGCQLVKRTRSMLLRCKPT